MSDFSIRNVISSAWKNVPGVKWPIWAALLVLFLIVFGITLIIGFIFTLTGMSLVANPNVIVAHSMGYLTVTLIIEIIAIFLTAPLATGAQMTALKKVRGEVVTPSAGFRYWHKWFSLGLSLIFFSIGLFVINIVFGFISTLAMSKGLMALLAIVSILGGIAALLYYTFFLFNLLFVADKDKAPFKALLCSAKAVSKHWFRVLVLWVFLGLVFIVTVLPVVLGLMCPYTWVKILGGIVSLVLWIWAVPYFHLILATAYNKLSEHSH